MRTQMSGTLTWSAFLEDILPHGRDGKVKYAEAARQLGFTTKGRARVWAWVNEDNVPDIDTVRLVARTYGIPEQQAVDAAGYGLQEPTTKERVAEEVKHMSRRLGELAGEIVALKD